MICGSRHQPRSISLKRKIGRYPRYLWNFDQTLIIIIMLAYLYCAAYTRMTMNESSPPCEQRRITFNDYGQRVQLARPELPAPHYICMYRLLPTTPPSPPGIITNYGCLIISGDVFNIGNMSSLRKTTVQVRGNCHCRQPWNISCNLVDVNRHKIRRYVRYLWNFD